MSYGYDGYDEYDDAAFWDEADNYVKGLKETLVEGAACTCCDGDVSEWDIETRDGICADCTWGRCPRSADGTCEASTIMTALRRDELAAKASGNSAGVPAGGGLR